MQKIKFLLSTILFLTIAGAATAQEATNIGHLEDVQMYNRVIHIMAMLLVGFGFLMVFVRKYGRSAITATFLLVSVALPMYFLLKGSSLFHHGGGNSEIQMLILAEFSAAGLLIAAGAILGRIPNIVTIESFAQSSIFGVNQIANCITITVASKLKNPIYTAFLASFKPYFSSNASVIKNKVPYIILPSVATKVNPKNVKSIVFVTCIFASTVPSAIQANKPVFPNNLYASAINKKLTNANKNHNISLLIIFLLVLISQDGYELRII